jgi:cell division septation protein DedD
VSRTRLVGLICLAGALAHRHTEAQTDPRLVSAVRLAQDGMSDSARAVVARILASLQPTDSLYPEVVYTSGLLAATERARRLELRRVVVEYPQSAWADDALLQLAQLDYAAGNPGATAVQIDQLLRDYPESPLGATAAFWGARAASDRHDPATACRMVAVGLRAVGSDIELRNQLEFQKNRCEGLATMLADSARTAVADSIAKARADSIARAKPGRPPPRRTGPPAHRAAYYVQIAAVPTRAAAVGDSARTRRAGYSAVIMKEGAYLKIRVPFATRAQAEAALPQVKAKLGGHPFLVRVP